MLLLWYVIECEGTKRRPFHFLWLRLNVAVVVSCLRFIAVSLWNYNSVHVTQGLLSQFDVNKLNHFTEQFSVIFTCVLLKMLAGQCSDSNHLFTLNATSCINISVFTQILTF